MNLDLSRNVMEIAWCPLEDVLEYHPSYDEASQCPLRYVEEPEQSADRPLELESRDGDSTDGAVMETTLAAVTTATLITNTNFTYFEEDADQHEFILMVLIPLILLALLFVILVILVTRYKRKRTKQEPSSQGSQNALQTCELGSENIKVPIFEEDTPSVMEIEMEELDKWMNNMNRNVTVNPETEWC
ncbi:transmembrane protein 154 isoform X5 [Panthera onca]